MLLSEHKLYGSTPSLQTTYDSLIKTVSDQTFNKCKQTGIKSAAGNTNKPFSWKRDCVLELHASIRQHKHLRYQDKLSNIERIIHDYYFCSTLFNLPTE